MEIITSWGSNLVQVHILTNFSREYSIMKEKFALSEQGPTPDLFQRAICSSDFFVITSYTGMHTEKQLTGQVYA